MAVIVVRVLCLLLIVFTYFNLGLAVEQRSAEQHPSKDFNRHTLIKPRIYHGREKRQISTTKEEAGGHLHHLTVTYDLDGHNYIIDLNLNRELIPKGYFHRYQKNGSDVVERPSAEEVELCHYRGKVRGKSDSWAALSTCDDSLKGMIFDGNEMHYIEKNSAEDEHHFLYKHSDVAENDKRCGYEGDAVDHAGEENSFNRILRYKRAIEPTIRGPYNANKLSRYVELVLVVDNMFYKELESKLYKVERYCKDITNIINAIYSSVNIFIALVGVVTWAEKNEIEFSGNGDTTLANFLYYRREQLIKDHPNDNAQLITKFTFNNGVVGKALKGPICTYEFSGGVNNHHSPIIGLVATTIAHEMGHNFGMEHDTNECACPEDRCIMAPSSSSVAPKHWSNCSIEYLALAFVHGMDYCLRNKPESLFGSPVCGNGFVEPGEQCDCGLQEHCHNTCCNATTCLLNANASCATGECCDLNTCKPKKAGTMCRSADIECDLPEYCTGHSEYCPADFYKLDAEICGGGKAYCYHGYCRTRSDQCKLLWGNTGKTSDEQCYKMNIKGNRHGNCGYNKLHQEYRKCGDENVLCGMLHCKHLNERLEFGMESVAILSHSFLNLKGSIIPCRTAIVDLGLNQVDPGLAPDGAKCGDGKMCVKQRCLAVDELRARGPKCPNDCNGNGVCNNLGHCHCKDGFAPPSCEYPGPGGSEDSGPATDPNARKEFVTAIFIIFLGIIPGLALLSFMVYYARQNMKITWTQSSSSTYVGRLFTNCAHSLTACMGVGGYIKKRKSRSTLPTVSEQVEQQQRIEQEEVRGRRKSRNMDIMFSRLIFTTNKDAINNSVSVHKIPVGDKANSSCAHQQQRNSLEDPPKRRLSFKNIKGLKLNTNVKGGKGKTATTSGGVCDKVEPLIGSVADKSNSLYGCRQQQEDMANSSCASQQQPISVEDPPKRRLSFKNIKGLKLNTNVKGGKGKIAATSSGACDTAEPLISETASTVSVKNLAKKFNFDNESKA